MKDIKYSSMRARYNRYCKIVDFFSWYGATWLFVAFPAAIGGGMFEAGIHNAFSIGCVVLAILMFIYTFIGGCLIDDKVSFEKFAECKSYEDTEKAIRKNQKWLS